MTSFLEDLFKTVLKTVDGVNVLIWSIFFLGKSINPKIIGTGEFDGWVYLLFIPVIFLMLIRSRINQDERIIFNVGSFLSVTIFSVIFIRR